MISDVSSEADKKLQAPKTTLASLRDTKGGFLDPGDRAVYAARGVHPPSMGADVTF